MRDSHTNVKEFATVVLAAQRWGPLWANKRVLVRSDNSNTVSCVMSRSPLIMKLMRCMFWLSTVSCVVSRSPPTMKLVRCMFWLSAVHTFRLSAIHVPGVDNVLADKISRLHELYSKQNLYDLLAASLLVWHMSCNGYIIYSGQVQSNRTTS